MQLIKAEKGKVHCPFQHLSGCVNSPEGQRTRGLIICYLGKLNGPKRKWLRRGMASQLGGISSSAFLNGGLFNSSC